MSSQTGKTVIPRECSILPYCIPGLFFGSSLAKRSTICHTILVNQIQRDTIHSISKDFTGRNNTIISISCSTSHHAWYIRNVFFHNISLISTIKQSLIRLIRVYISGPIRKVGIRYRFRKRPCTGTFSII